MRLARAYARVTRSVPRWVAPMRPLQRPVLWMGSAFAFTAAASVVWLAESAPEASGQPKTAAGAAPADGSTEPKSEVSDEFFGKRAVRRAWESVRGLGLRIWTSYRSLMPEEHKKPLIPPPLPPQYRRPFVLVVDLEALLKVSYGKNGWQTIKRPGVDYFLSYSSGVAEIITFSTLLNPSVGWAIVGRLDTTGTISYKFFEDFDRDIDSLNRPMEKLLILGPDPKRFEGYEANFVRIPDWTGTLMAEDTSLLDLCTFLQELTRYANQVQDVRLVIAKFKDNPKSIPEVYHEKTKQKLGTKEQQLGGKAQGGFFGR